MQTLSEELAVSIASIIGLTVSSGRTMSQWSRRGSSVRGAVPPAATGSLPGESGVDTIALALARCFVDVFCSINVRYLACVASAFQSALQLKSRAGMVSSANDGASATCVAVYALG